MVGTTARNPLITRTAHRFLNSNEVHRVADYARSTQRGEIPCTDVIEEQLCGLLFVATTNLAMNKVEDFARMVIFHQSKNTQVFGPPTLKKLPTLSTVHLNT